jgi:hypothetical protein
MLSRKVRFWTYSDKMLQLLLLDWSSRYSFAKAAIYYKGEVWNQTYSPRQILEAICEER